MRQKKWVRFQSGKEFMRSTVIPAFERNKIKADALKECGKIINTIICKNCSTKHFAGFRRCKNRFCVNCNYVRSLAWVARLIPFMKEWINQGNYIQMLVLTIKDGEDLKERVKFLETSWRTLYHDNKNMRDKWKREFAGGLRSLEIVVGKNSNKWHPHMHLLLLKDHYNKDYEWIKSNWKSITNNNGSIYIKSIQNDNLLKGVVECVKYIMKPERKIFNDDKRFLEMWETVKGKRQINTWGCLRGIKTKVIEDDIENIEVKKLEAFICSQCGCTKGQLRAYLYDKIKNDNLFDIVPK